MQRTGRKHRNEQQKLFSVTAQIGACFIQGVHLKIFKSHVALPGKIFFINL